MYSQASHPTSVMVPNHHPSGKPCQGAQPSSQPQPRPHPAPAAVSAAPLSTCGCSRVPESACPPGRLRHSHPLDHWPPRTQTDASVPSLSTCPSVSAP